MALIDLESIDAVTEALLSDCGVPEKSIGIILDTIHYANRRGMPTHGIGRLPLYVKKIRSGFFNPADEACVVMDSGALAIMDGKGGFGQVTSTHAMDLAIEKAREYGIAAVGVKNSNNFGMAGYFGDYAAKAGMAAMIYANASPAMAPTGGTKPILGTNPLCFSFPGSDLNTPIILDMATTVVARGKVRLAAKTGQELPDGWALDENGQPTNDPNLALKGSLYPIGGYKGYGLSLFVDVFAGLLTGSAYAGGVQQLSKMDAYSNNGHLFVVMDVSRFMDQDSMNQRIDFLYETIRSCGEPGTVKLPGENGYIKMSVNTKAVEIPDKQVEEINELAAKAGISLRLTRCSDNSL